MTTVNDEELVEQIASEEEDKEAGVPLYRIVSYPSDPQLDGLCERWRRKEIRIPTFQRGWVWTHVQASRLIESFLMGLPVPPIFVFREPSTESLLVIDGQQRLKTICGFFDQRMPDGTAFFLKGVDPRWEGKYYSTLDEDERIRLRNSVLRMVTVEQMDPKDTTSVFHIFERLNTGGTGLTPQEVRNCVAHGPFNDQLVELNKDATWRSIFGIARPDPRMRDVELVVRFCALFEPRTTYTKPMKQFLNNFMKKHQYDESLEPYGSKFVEAAQRVYEVLGSRPFHIKRGINAAVYDAVMLAFAKSRSTPRDINSRWGKLLANPSYQDAVSAGTTDELTVARRIQLAQTVLFG